MPVAVALVVLPWIPGGGGRVRYFGLYRNSAVWSIIIALNCVTT